MLKPSTIDRSYEVLALLHTCELALGAVRQAHVGEDVGNIAMVIKVAARFAAEVHDAIETHPSAMGGANG